MTYILIFILGAICGTLCLALLSYDQTTRLQHEVMRLKDENLRLKYQVENLSRRKGK